MSTQSEMLHDLAIDAYCEAREGGNHETDALSIAVDAVLAALASSPAPVGEADGRISREQAIVIMGFTGIATVRFDHFHLDVEQRLGRPVWSHQFADKSLMETIREVYRADFMALLPEWDATPQERQEAQGAER